jgi:hypothetical protein
MSRGGQLEGVEGLTGNELESLTSQFSCRVDNFWNYGKARVSISLRGGRLTWL